MTDQHDGSAQRLEEARDVIGVGGQVLERVGDRPRVVALLLQRGDLAVPAGRVCPPPCTNTIVGFTPLDGVAGALAGGT